MYWMNGGISWAVKARSPSWEEVEVDLYMNCKLELPREPIVVEEIEGSLPSWYQWPPPILLLLLLLLSRLRLSLQGRRHVV